MNNNNDEKNKQTKTHKRTLPSSLVSSYFRITACILQAKELNDFDHVLEDGVKALNEGLGVDDVPEEEEEEEGFNGSETQCGCIETSSAEEVMKATTQQLDMDFESAKKAAAPATPLQIHNPSFQKTQEALSEAVQGVGKVTTISALSF